VDREEHREALVWHAPDEDGRDHDRIAERPAVDGGAAQPALTRDALP
jgi:hypothetical protein